jgi:tRNA (guanine-N7-)-methyltransferase
MARNKLYKYNTIRQSQFVFENIYNTDLELASNWHNIFDNSNPIVLEVACGYGEYTIGLAIKNPDINFIGLDIKGDRLYQGLQKMNQYNLPNVRFIRSRCEDITSLFAPNELTDIWIIHPDPQPKKETKRLIYKRFMEIYKTVLKPSGNLYLRTDNKNLFQYSLDSIITNPDWLVQYFSWDYYNSPWFEIDQNFITRYQKQFNNSTIKLLHLRLNQKS